ncbi:MAG: hypothetical protein WAZ18_01245 [Alphaproteobacteria bacterium]
MRRTLALLTVAGGLVFAEAPKVMAQAPASVGVEDVLSGKTALKGMSEETFSEIDKLIDEMMDQRIPIPTRMAFRAEIEAGKTPEDAAKTVGMTPDDLKLLQKWDEVGMEDLNRRQAKTAEIEARLKESRRRLSDSLGKLSNDIKDFMGQSKN